MLRNKEIQRFAVLFAAITVVCAGAGLVFCPSASILILASAAAYGAAFFVFTRTRYRSIARLSEQIDQVLHNSEQLSISDSEEGELSILQSEIMKMTLRIREQNEALKKEKKHLADSLADIAHQLRTPLTSANLVLSLLKNHPRENERRHLLREMDGLFVQMDWLITSLLKLSRLDAGIVIFRSGRIPVDSLVKAAMRSLLIPMDLHNITLRTSVPGGIEIQGDEEWLSEAVQNILKNCIESAGDNGWIEIACRDTLLFTEITIRDSGTGFAEEDLPRLFERFYRGKNSAAAGYGIGLALCKTIISRQGGTVSAGNHPEGGAEFIIRFPK